MNQITDFIHRKKVLKNILQSVIMDKCLRCKLKGVRNMALLQEWQKVAYNEKANKQELQKFWQRYFLLEKSVYERLLENPDEKVEGTVQELADKYKLSLMDMTGFLDGINDSLVEPNPIETMEADTKVSLAFDKEKLYKNMVDAKADWLYDLPMWDNIFDADKKKSLYLEQKKSGTVVVGKKVGRNDPCPCGSGKKYKFCCGR
jgi:hypothetical protein